jgi:O-antigen chain-terminating methyltransferase
LAAGDRRVAGLEVKAADAAARLHRLDEALDARDQHLARLDDALAARDQRSAQLEQALAVFDQRLAQVDDSLAARDQRSAQLEQALAVFDQRLAQVDDSLAARDRRLAQLEQVLAARDQRLAQLEQALAAREQRLAELRAAAAASLRHDLTLVDRRVTLLLEVATKRLRRNLDDDQLRCFAAAYDHRFDGLYAGLEDRFRGSREDIKTRQRIYLPHIRPAQAGAAAAPVVDLGCGRGEWLELLREEGVSGHGVDVNHVFLEQCRELGLEVTESDAVDFLRGLPTAASAR